MGGKGGVGKKREQCDVYQHVRSYLLLFKPGV